MNSQSLVKSRQVGIVGGGELATKPNLAASAEKVCAVAAAAHLGYISAIPRLSLGHTSAISRRPQG